MNPTKILNKAEKQEIESRLSEQFGVDSIPGKIIKSGKERLFLFTGDFDEKDIKSIEKLAFIERLGVYIARIDEFGEIRLSIEGTQILKNQITKNIFSLNSEQAEQWMKGHELQIKTGMKGFVAIKYEEDFLGTGKASENKIGNFIPKNRRLREKTN
ncbi:MAG TPA: hypothetical protein VJ208_02610 [Candidatus Nanoarchaeia archaeon]|nr:hypothetical protein [Candidatus Nanoarchaeia archaeon]